MCFFFWGKFEKLDGSIPMSDEDIGYVINFLNETVLRRKKVMFRRNNEKKKGFIRRVSVIFLMVFAIYVGTVNENEIEFVKESNFISEVVSA